MTSLPNPIGPAVAALVFLALTILALRARKAWIRWPGLILSGLLTVFCILLTVLVLRGHSILTTPTTNPVVEITVAGKPEQIARGKQIATTCAFCHSSSGKLPLDGGKEDYFGGFGPMGSLYPPNLTPAGGLKDWSDGQILRALREGVDDQNLPLMIMPSSFYHVMSDADAQSVVAFLRSQPPVEHDVPERSLGWMAEALIGSGAFPTSAQAAITAPQSAPPAGPTAEYGKYLVSAYVCGGCHGADLAGKQPGQGPAGSNLTQLIHPMKQDVFIKTIRTSKDDEKGMPYEEISSIATDEDLTAMYLYIHSLTPLPSK